MHKFPRSVVQFPVQSTRRVAVQRFKCWNCTHTPQLGEVFCQKCKTIQPVTHSDFFSYFGLKRRFSLDEAELKTLFRRMQSRVHPDKFGTGSARERTLSEQHSSYLNQAYKTLRSPRDRAKYLLGLLTQEDQDETTTPDQAAEMFEFIEELEAERDARRLRQKRDHVEAEAESLLIQVENAFDKEDLVKARELLTRLRYFDRAADILRTKLGED